MAKNIVRIVQPEASESGLVRTQGTKVLLADDTEMEGVTKIILTAEPASLWKAEIHCHAQFTDLSALAEFTYPTRWQRFKRWLRYG